MNSKQCPITKEGDTARVLPASDVGRVPSPIDGESTGIFIIMDLVTLGSSICSSGMTPKFNNSYKKTQENGEKIKKND